MLVAPAPYRLIVRDISLLFNPKLNVILSCFNLLPPLHSLLTSDSLAMLHKKHYISAEQSPCCSDAPGNAGFETFDSLDS